MPQPATAEQILDVAEELLRHRGYNAFSYADIAQIVGIRKASIHYHFATKAELGRALVQRYCQQFFQRRQQLEQISSSVASQLNQFIRLYQSGLAEDKICLCNMLLTDSATLPAAINQEVTNFINNNTAWLTRIFNTGSQNGDWQNMHTSERDAQGLLATLHGAQLIARSSAEPEQAFEQALQPWRSQFGLS